MAISLVCGLGNPGDKYSKTRHNAGFWFLGLLTQEYGLTLSQNSRFKSLTGDFKHGSRLIRACAPQNYMNRSGESLAPLARFFQIPAEAILVVHDEIDLPPGVARLKKGGGHGGHNGLRDIITHLGSKEFFRLRIGVGRPNSKEQGAAHVLRKTPNSEMQLIEQAMANALAVMPDVLSGDIAKAMNQLHSQA